jgi:hypothetical protein
LSILNGTDQSTLKKVTITESLENLQFIAARPGLDPNGIEGLRRSSDLV